MMNYPEWPEAAASCEVRKAGLVHIVSGRLLLVRTKGNDVFYIPGGKPISREKPDETLQREVMEELGCVVNTELMRHYADYVLPCYKDESRRVFISTWRAPLIGDPTACGEIEELAYFPYCQATAIGPAAAQILADLYKQRLVEG